MFISRSFFNMYVESFWIPANKSIVLQFHLSGKAKEDVIFYRQQKTQSEANILGGGKTLSKYLSRSLCWNFMNNLWGLGTEQEYGCHSGPPGYT